MSRNPHTATRSSSVRIIAGAAGGTHLVTPPGSAITRPSTERVREAVFSWLESRGWLTADTAVLDLYAGSGALGLEAASRGAGRVTLVERDRKALEACRANAAKISKIVDASIQVVSGTVASFLAAQQPAPGTPGSWDLILADPPYELTGPELNSMLAAATVALVADGMIVLEASVRSPDPVFPDEMELIDDRSYGETRIIYARRNSAGQGS